LIRKGLGKKISGNFFALRLALMAREGDTRCRTATPPPSKENTMTDLNTPDPRPELGAIAPGDMVWLRRSPSEMLRRDASERYVEARVTKAGPVWIYLESTGTGFLYRMRRSTQDEATQYWGRNKSFVTDAQRAWDIRRDEALRHLDTQDEALRYLAFQGIHVAKDGAWHDREVELASILRAAQ
jgi:hypothetical protein